MERKRPDPVLDEIREVRHRISARFGHDPERLVAYYMELQEKYRDRMIGAPSKGRDNQFAADPTMARRAKLVQVGDDQAVQLPKEFWFEGEEVLVSRQGNQVVLEPVQRTSQTTWSQVFLELAGSCPDFPYSEDALAREMEEGYRAEAEDPSLDDEWPR